jgi:hypothetical protein
MSYHAAKSAAQPNSSLKAPSVASVSFRTRRRCAQSCPSTEPLALMRKLRLRRTSDAEEQRMTWCIGEPSASYPVLCSGSRFGAKTGARRHGVVLLRLRRPCGVSVPPKRSLKAAATNAAQTSFGPRQESTPWHLGAGPTRLASPV